MTSCHCYNPCSCANVAKTCSNANRGSSGISGIYRMAPPGLTTENHDNRVRASLARLVKRLGKDATREALLNFKVLPAEEAFVSRTLALLRGVWARYVAFNVETGTFGNLQLPHCANCGSMGVIIVPDEGWTRCLRCDFYEGPSYESRFDQALSAGWVSPKGCDTASYTIVGALLGV